jgi:nitrogen-specific signal transduction histidine kinase
MENLVGNISVAPNSTAKAEEATIEYQRAIVESFLVVKPFIDDVNHMFVILNKQRKIVYINKLAQVFFVNDNLIGQRLGEAINCIHSYEINGGCGTTESCAKCGQLNVVLNSQKSGLDKRECRITSENNTVYDLEIWAKNIEIDNYSYTIVSITDISSKKRKEVLERLFFHDILNTAGSLKNFIELMQDASSEEIAEFSKLGLEISETLIDELKGQRMLGLAEDSKFQLDISEFDVYLAFNEIISTYNNGALCENATLKLINNNDKEICIRTDKTLLKRVLGNLVKNALEASPSGGIITLSIKIFDTTIVLCVNNDCYMPMDIQLQIFQRSFSTKGAGRGIGTYSVKLLTEKYLKGEVSFSSTEELGTTFCITIPKEI